MTPEDEIAQLKESIRQLRVEKTREIRDLRNQLERALLKVQLLEKDNLELAERLLRKERA